MTRGAELIQVLCELLRRNHQCHCVIEMDGSHRHCRAMDELSASFCWALLGLGRLLQVLGYDRVMGSLLTQIKSASTHCSGSGAAEVGLLTRI